MRSEKEASVIEALGRRDDWRNLCLSLGVGCGALAGGLIGFAVGPLAAISGAAIGAAAGATTGLVIAFCVSPRGREMDSDDALGPPELDILPKRFDAI